MSRSTKKGPYIDLKLLKKVMKQKDSGDRSAIRTWARASTIPPQFVGHKFAIHTGRTFWEIVVTEDMVGHKLGEFATSRTWRGHTNKKEDKKKR